MDPRLARLLDKQEIQETIYAYCRGIDRRDLDTVRACYHPNATDEHGSFSGGVDAYLDWVDGLLARYAWTMHFVGNVLIELEDGPHPVQAVAESYGIAIHRSDDGKPHLNLATAFRYLDRFERREDRWKIAARIAVSEASIQIPAGAWWSTPEAFEKGRRDSSDALYALLAGLRGSDLQPEPRAPQEPYPREAR